MSEAPSQSGSRNDLTAGSLPRTLLRLAGPIAGAMVLHAAYSLVDAFWLGRWSTEALAAQGLSLPIFFVLVMFGIGLGGAGTALVSQYSGAGRPREADHAAAQTLLLLCVVSVVLSAAVMLLAPALLRLMQAPPETIPLARTYLRILLPGLPFVMFAVGYGAILRGVGDTVTVVIIIAAANAMNMVLDPLLIFGMGGFPKLGIGGAALASVISQVVGAGACYAFLRRGRGALHVRPADFRPDWPALRRVFSVGVPMAVHRSSDTSGSLVFQVIINSLGTTVVGAFTVGFRVIQLLDVWPYAMAMAAAPVVGQALGAGRPRLARRAIKVSALLVGAAMLAPMALLILGGELVARAFIDNPEVIAEAGRFFLIIPASSYVFGVLIVLMAALFGSGHARPVMAVANVCAAAIAYFLFMGGGWQRSLVGTEEARLPGRPQTQEARSA